MIRKTYVLIPLVACVMVACAADTTNTPIAATASIPTETAAPTNTPIASATDDIDAQLTSIALTVHPQLTPAAVHTATAQALIATSTPTLPSTLIMPILEANQVWRGVWSPDGEWVSFWINAKPPDDPDYSVIILKPVYLEVSTGRICMVDQFASDVYTQPTYDYWMDDGDSVIVSEGTPYVGKPCGEFIRAPDSFEQPDPGATMLSPDGRYLAETVYKVEPNNATTTITLTETGEVVDQIDWMYVNGLGGAPMRWLDNRRLLFERMWDRGPMLLTVQGERIDILPTLFGLEPTKERITWAWAYGAVDQQTGHTHILLTQNGMPLLLYHFESGMVEELPFESTWGLRTADYYHSGFSPDGHWLLLANPAAAEQDDWGPSWIRAVDPPHLPATIFAANGSAGTFAEITQRLAYTEVYPTGLSSSGVVIAAFPNNHILTDYRHSEYSLSAMVWSPDGTKLLIIGARKNFDPSAANAHAVFIVEP